jgi:hypothetical protein
MEDDPEKVESRWLSFSVTPDLKNGSRFKNIFYDTVGVSLLAIAVDL